MIIQNRKKPHLQFEVSKEEWDQMEIRQRSYRVINEEDIQTLKPLIREKIIIPTEVEKFQGGQNKKAGPSGKNEKTEK